MRKKPINFLLQDNNLIETSLNQNKEFLYNFQLSLLMALLEKNQITQYQFEQCAEEIRKF